MNPARSSLAGGGYLDDLDPLDERQFLIAVKRLADGLTFGVDRSPFLGSGLEYVQSRPYQPGDPVKSIDWRVTGRTGRFFVKEYEAPKRLPAYLLIDTSASMTLHSGTLSKYALALQVAGGIALACLDRATPVGVLGVGQRDIKVQPSLSRDRVLEWFHRLRHFRYDEGTTLGRRLGELVPALGDSSLLVVLSDLHDAEAVPALQLAGQRHDTVVIQFEDPAEQGLGGVGWVQAREAESGHEFVTRGKRGWSNPGAVASAMRQSGVDHLAITVGQGLPIDAALRHFFGARGALGRGAR